MSSRPSAQLRRKVVERADSRCEYCMIHQEDAVSTHQVDHVIAEKHGGKTALENLALSCMTCNLHDVQSSRGERPLVSGSRLKFHRTALQPADADLARALSA
ncbi:HNH endonuclease [Planctellipticum variicoloris]|uniref:HNH endonuclease n=1 Tax=Planctellipticum variicoloris TaxID=3064265 RepID=UPI003AF63448